MPAKLSSEIAQKKSNGLAIAYNLLVISFRPTRKPCLAGRPLIQSTPYSAKPPFEGLLVLDQADGSLFTISFDDNHFVLAI